MFYARNIKYGELYVDAFDVYRVSVVFDVYENDKLLEKDVQVNSYIREIQQAIVAKVKGTERFIASEISHDEAVGLYADITQNTELFFE